MGSAVEIPVALHSGSAVLEWRARRRTAAQSVNLTPTFPP